MCVRALYFKRYSWNKSHLVLNNKHPFTNVFENIQQINRKKERGHSILVLKKKLSFVVHENELLYISSVNGISRRIYPWK